MTKVISLLNQKGGSGKTTIATNLGHALLLNHCRVLFVDADPQGTLRDWHEQTGGEIAPVIGLDRETLPKDLRAVSGDYDYVVIDGAPQIAKLMTVAVKASDLVLIPVTPSPYDIWACADLVDVIKARQDVTDGQPQAAFVISRAIQHTKLSQEIGDALAAYDLPVLTARTTQRVCYPQSAAEGQTIFSDKRNLAAIQEMTQIMEAVKEMINGTQS